MSTKTYYYVFEPDSISALPEMRSFEAKDFGPDRIQAKGGLPDFNCQRTIWRTVMRGSLGICETPEKALDWYTQKLASRIQHAKETVARGERRMTQLPLQARYMDVVPAEVLQ